MNENTTQLIEQLAQKLGTTAEYLWSVLLRQAPISATVELVQIGLTIVFGMVLFRLHKYFMRETEQGYGNRYDESPESYIFMLILLIGFLLLLIMSLCLLESIVNGFFNPEYWALDKILNSI